MRFTTTIASLATIAVASAHSGVGLGVGLGLGVGVGAAVDVKAVADVNAHILADVGAKVKAHADVDIDLEIAGKKGTEVEVEIEADVQVALGLVGGFHCPAGMTYSPWLKSCSCAPGLSLDVNSKKCVGRPITGCWPEPKCEATGVTVVLGKFCAVSPTKFVKYDENHKWCQASVETITFCADVEIEAEIKALGLGIDLDVEIDVNAAVGVSETLKHVTAGLAGLYLETLAQAVVLFNTNVLGLVTVAADVDVGILGGLWAQISGVVCLLGLGNCHYDCVSYCTEGCKNYIDVEGGIGGRIGGLLGITILPDVILVLNSVKVVVSVVVSDLLCIVGRIVKSLLTTYDCGCHH